MVHGSWGWELHGFATGDMAEEEDKDCMPSPMCDVTTEFL